MAEETIKSWLEANRYSSHKFAEHLRNEHDLEVSAETVQRWMRGWPISERHREIVAKVTKLKLPKAKKAKAKSDTFGKR